MRFFQTMDTDLKHRAFVCNYGNPYLCFISLEVIKDLNNDLAFAYNSEAGGSVPIHKKYNTPELRKQWLAKENGSSQKKRT